MNLNSGERRAARNWATAERKYRQEMEKHIHFWEFVNGTGPPTEHLRAPTSQSDLDRLRKLHQGAARAQAEYEDALAASGPSSFPRNALPRCPSWCVADHRSERDRHECHSEFFELPTVDSGSVGVAAVRVIDMRTGEEHDLAVRVGDHDLGATDAVNLAAEIEAASRLIGDTGSV